MLIPPVINLCFNTQAFIFPDFFGFVTSDTKGAWIGFYGSIIGGLITLIGVAWTIIDQNKKRREDVKDSTRPTLISSEVTYEKIKCEKNNCNGRKIFECIIKYKNVGKGILYNPSVYNVICTLDDVDISSSIHPTIPVLVMLI